MKNVDLDLKTFGKRISSRRKAMRIKQRELAEYVGISNKYLSNIENGKASPSLNVFFNICYCLETTPDTILLGIAKTDNIPLVISDMLKLCNDESIKKIQDFVEYVLNSQ